MSNQKEFPTLEEFSKWYYEDTTSAADIYNYFKDRVRTVMPEVGKEYEATTVVGRTIKGELLGFFVGFNEAEYCKSIRPIPAPTRDEVLAKAKKLGLTDEEIEVLGGAK